MDHGDEGLLAYAVHPGMIGTEMGKRMPEHLHWLLNDSTELAGDTIAFLTRERREWLRSRYISGMFSSSMILRTEMAHTMLPSRHSYLGYGGAVGSRGRDRGRRQVEG